MIGAPPPTPSMIANEMGDIIANVTEHANEMNRRWGFNRLPHIVSLDLMRRFKEQQRKWQLACFECCGSMLPADLDRVRKHGEAMKRAYGALEAEALALGKSPTPPGQWEFELKNGTPVVLVRTRAELGSVTRDPPAQVWCLEEIGEIITKFPELLAGKELFPGAEIIQIAPSAEVRELVDDILSDIPFGG
jgi:hypothetical protein